MDVVIVVVGVGILGYVAGFLAAPYFLAKRRQRELKNEPYDSD